MSLRKGEGVEEESNKKWLSKEGVQSKSDFTWSSVNITASNKKSTSKKKPTSASEITI